MLRRFASIKPHFTLLKLKKVNRFKQLRNFAIIIPVNTAVADAAVRCGKGRNISRHQYQDELNGFPAIIREAHIIIGFHIASPSFFLSYRSYVFYIDL